MRVEDLERLGLPDLGGCGRDFVHLTETSRISRACAEVVRYAHIDRDGVARPAAVGRRASRPR